VRPDVSIIIPMFDAAPTVERALQSTLDQQGLAVEVIVVNDGSRDGGPGIVERFAQSEEHVRLISQPNMGLAAARNTGIAASRGEFLHFLDADDWLLPGGLMDLVSTARASGSGAAYGGSQWHAEGGQSLDWVFEPSCPLVGHQELLECGRFQPACQLIARTLLGDLCFRDRHPGAEDHDLWLRLAERGVRWAACDRPVCAYRLRRGGMSRRFLMMGQSLIGATSESFDRARRRRGGDSAADLAFARESEIVDRIALDHATGAAASACAPLRADAGALLAHLGRAAAVTPEHAAASALWMIPYADCQPPSAWSAGVDAPRLTRYLRSAVEWWMLLSNHGRAASELAERGVPALAELAPDNAAIAGRIASQIGPGERIALYGLGRQARALAPRLIERGAHVIGVDDALPAGVRDATVGGLKVEVAPLSVALTGAAACVVAADRDEAMVSRIGNGSRVIRWREVRRSLAAEGRRGFERALESGAALLHRRDRAA
jgi:hypothetical protein